MVRFSTSPHCAAVASCQKQQNLSLTRPRSRVGLSEEQIIDIFSSAGKVERFRLVYDTETGRPKGFGFADYPDTGTALFNPRRSRSY